MLHLSRFTAKHLVFRSSRSILKPYLCSMSQWNEKQQEDYIGENELDLSSVHAVVKKVIYHNDANGYSVLSVIPKELPGNRSVNVIGTFISPAPGEHIEVRGGTWKQRGEEFQIIASHIAPENPTTTAEIEIYLPKLFKGIGKKRAKDIVAKFGSQVFNIIENNPSQLLKVPGLGSKKLEVIIKPYLEKVSARDLVDFFAKYGLTSDHGLAIWRKFGNNSVAMIKEDPYILSQEVKGFSFSQADELAKQLKVPETSEKRIVAAAKHVLLVGAIRNGHCVLPLPQLLIECGEILKLPPYTIYEVLLAELHSEEKLLSIPQPHASMHAQAFHDSVNFFLNEEESSSFIAKREVFNQESGIAADLERIRNSSSHPFQHILDREGKDNILDGIVDGLSEGQKGVIELALKEHVLIVTGGPGVGKTATVTRVMKLFEKYDLPMLVCAPTGRAAIRLQEISGTPASTVHRLLECSAGFSFLRSDENPLSCKLLVVDEFSMMDLSLTHALFKALPDDILLVIVGDSDQLPSVGPGNVLKDMILSQRCKVHHLTEVFRQKELSGIITAAHTINKGYLPDLSHTISHKTAEITTPSSDFCFIESTNPTYIVNTINSLISYVLPQMGYSSDNVQILTPVNKRDLGAVGINFQVQQQINPYSPDKAEVTILGTTFRVGDKVMQIQNNYDKNIYNGEMGKILSIGYVNTKGKRRASELKVDVKFDRQDDHEYESYNQTEMAQITLAYAVTIHKSQGNEFPVVIIPLHLQHSRMLQRNLIYTAVTRGKKLVILVGDKEAFSVAVSTINAQGEERYTTLSNTIKDSTPETARIYFEKQIQERAMRAEQLLEEIDDCQKKE